MKKYIIGGIILLILAGGVFVMTKSKNQPDETTPVSESEPAASPSTQVAGATTADKNPATQEFTVVGSNFKFVPSELRVKKGNKVKIVFQNQEGTHNLRLDEFNVTTKVIQGGETDTVEFTADKLGQFAYYCSIGNHRQMGMAGTLTVE